MKRLFLILALAGTASAQITYPTSGGNTATGINGATAPNSANVTGTNSSGQITSQSATNISAITSCTAGGTANAQTVTCAPAVTAITTGLQISWIPTVSNTSAATLAVNGLTATSITVCPDSRAISSGDITSGVPALVIDRGSSFTLLNPQVSQCQTSFQFNPNFNGQNALNIGILQYGSSNISEGVSIASASTIVPTNAVFHITGTTTVNIMTPLTGMNTTVGAGEYGGCVTIIADGAVPIAAGTAVGAFKSSATLTAGVPYQACYTASTGLWYLK